MIRPRIGTIDMIKGTHTQGWMKTIAEILTMNPKHGVILPIPKSGGSTVMSLNAMRLLQVLLPCVSITRKPSTLALNNAVGEKCMRKFETFTGRNPGLQVHRSAAVDSNVISWR